MFAYFCWPKASGRATVPVCWPSGSSVRWPASPVLSATLLIIELIMLCTDHVIKTQTWDAHGQMPSISGCEACKLMLGLQQARTGSLRLATTIPPQALRSIPKLRASWKAYHVLYKSRRGKAAALVQARGSASLDTSTLLRTYTYIYIYIYIYIHMYV